MWKIFCLKHFVRKTKLDFLVHSTVSVVLQWISSSLYHTNSFRFSFWYRKKIFVVQHDIIFTTEGYIYNLWATKKILSANVRCWNTFVFSLLLIQLERRLNLRRLYMTRILVMIHQVYHIQGVTFQISASVAVVYQTNNKSTRNLRFIDLIRID